MKQQQNRMENDRWAVYCAQMMQRHYEKEIEEAVEQVKRGISGTKIQKQPRRRKRGYWTPTGFAWFKRRKKWRKRYWQKTRSFRNGIMY